MKKINLIIFTLLIFAFISFASAESEIGGILLGINSDNLDKVYSPEINKIDITTKDKTLVGSLKLLTNQKQFVSPGINKTIATLKINNSLKGYEFNEFIKEMELYNLKNGGTFDREVYYKLVSYSYTQELKTKCNYSFGISANGTNYSICNKIYYLENITLKHQNDFEKYIPIGEFDLDIVMDVLPNEHGEWIFTAYDIRLPEFAEWDSGLNNSLVSYFKFDGDLLDVFALNNLTNSGTTNTSGKIGDARNFVYASSQYAKMTTDTNIPYGTTSRTINMWAYSVDVANYRDLFWYGAEATNQLFHFRQNNNGKLWIQEQGGGSLEANIPLSINTWHMITITFDGTNTRLYQDGVNVGNTTSINFNTGTTYKPYVGSYRDNSEFWDGKIDEVGVWNRSLTPSEITQLYNSGDGLPFGPPITPPTSNTTLTLNSPADTFNSTIQEVIFNATVYDGNYDIINVSFYLNGVINETNSSGLNNTDYIFTKTLVTGDYNWFVGACNNQSDCVNASSRSLSVALNLSGYVLNGSSIGIADASVILNNQSDNSFVANVTTNGSGFWTYGPVAPGIYIGEAYLTSNSSLPGHSLPHIIIP